MCTVHANSAREAIVKMCTLPLLAGENVSSEMLLNRHLAPLVNEVVGQTKLPVSPPGCPQLPNRCREPTSSRRGRGRERLCWSSHRQGSLLGQDTTPTGVGQEQGATRHVYRGGARCEPGVCQRLNHHGSAHHTATQGSRQLYVPSDKPAVASGRTDDAVAVGHRH